MLIISYYWPPSGGAGVQRWLKFTKYLKQFNIEPYILTVDSETASYPVLDKSLLNDVPKDVLISTAKIFDPNNFYEKLLGKKAPQGTISKKEKKSFIGKITGFVRSNLFVPDSRMLWHFHATKIALDLLKTHNIKTVITTGPPHSTHLIGLKLKAKCNFKWIVDFRDPWSKSFFNDYLKRNEFAVKKDEKLEQKVIEKADETIVVSEGMKNDFVIPLKNVTTIYNGYDEADFESKKTQQTKQFVISYTGNFKDNQNIKAVWEAVEELFEENQSFKKDFELHFAGNINVSIKKDLHQYKFNQAIKYHGYVSHNTAINYMIKSAVLLFPIPQAAYNENIITGKIFEYLASKTPILSLGPQNGKAADILNTCARSPMKKYDDKIAIKAFIFSEYLLWKKNGNRKVKGEKHTFYSRINQTKELAKLI